MIFRDNTNIKNAKMIDMVLPIQIEENKVVLKEDLEKCEIFWRVH